MQLRYVTNARIPTNKAYGIQTVSMCAAFSAQGIEVTLVAPKRANTITQDVFSYYQLPRAFTMVYLPIVDAIGIGTRFGFFVTRITYAFSVFFSPLLKKKDSSIIFTRDHIAGLLLRLRGNKVFYDMHGFPEKHIWIWKYAMRRMNGIICTNEWKITQCREKFGIPSHKLLCARNGFDASLFRNPLSKIEAREILSLPKEKHIVVYTGHLYDWKGVDVVAEAAALCADILFLFVGGTDADIAKFKNKYAHRSNIVLTGQRPHNEIPVYLWAADILLLPNSKHSKEKRFEAYSQYDTSPLKLFEYMASGRPIIASALPSIKEVLNEEHAALIPPDDATALSRAIRTLLDNYSQSSKRAHTALENVQQYTWDNRARRIIGFIHQHI